MQGSKKVDCTIFRVCLIFGHLFLAAQAQAECQAVVSGTPQSDMDVCQEEVQDGLFDQDQNGILEQGRQRVDGYIQNDTFQAQWGMPANQFNEALAPEDQRRDVSRTFGRYLNTRYVRPTGKQAQKAVKSDFKGEKRKSTRTPSNVSPEAGSEARPAPVPSKADMAAAKLVQFVQSGVDSNVGGMKDTKLTVRAKPHKKSMTFVLRNPVVDYEFRVSDKDRGMRAHRNIPLVQVATEVTYTKDNDGNSLLQANMTKKVTHALSANVNYNKAEQDRWWNTSLDQQLTDKISARVGSQFRPNTAADRSIQLIYGSSF